MASLATEEEAEIPPLTGPGAAADDAPAGGPEVAVRGESAGGLLVTKLRAMTRPNAPAKRPERASERVAAPPSGEADRADRRHGDLPPPSAPATGQVSTIVVLMPTLRSDLSVGGPIGQARSEEWSGPRRVFRTPALTAPRDYTIGAFWTPRGQARKTRSLRLSVAPGETYELDLRRETPTWKRVTPPPRGPRS